MCAREISHQKRNTFKLHFVTPYTFLKFFTWSFHKNLHWFFIDWKWTDFVKLPPYGANLKNLLHLNLNRCTWHFFEMLSGHPVLFFPIRNCPDVLDTYKLFFAGICYWEISKYSEKKAWIEALNSLVCLSFPLGFLKNAKKIKSISQCRIFRDFSGI